MLRMITRSTSVPLTGNAPDGITGAAGGEHLRHEPVAEVDDDRLDVRGQGVHAAAVFLEWNALRL